MRGFALIWALALVVGCQDAQRTHHGPGAGGIGNGASVGGGGSGGTEVIRYSCEGDDCPACARGKQCAADESTWIDETCCAHGDPLVHRGVTGASEAVDVVSDGTVAALCGGFGATIVDVSDPTSPRAFGSATSRCQNATFGGTHEGSKRLFLSHHGDSWVDEPSLTLVGVGANSVTQWASLTEPGVLYEGLAFGNDHLFAAVHAGGVRVYSLTDPMLPAHVHTVTGLTNAWEIAIADDHAFVADYDAGVRVIDITTPGSATLVATVATTGKPRHVSVHESRLFVSEGGFGVDVFDISTPTAPALVGNIPVRGSAQASASNGEVVAVAAWSHVATYDASTFRLVGTERLRGYPDFEQDLGVDIVGNHIYVAEWETLHILEHQQGMIAPDLWVDEKQFFFAAGEPDVRAVVVENRGDLPLRLWDIRTDASQFSVAPAPLTIAHGQGDAFEVAFQPPAVASTGTLLFSTNDVDRFDEDFQAGLVTAETNRLDVGDLLPDDFAFLDPNGAFDINGLDGKVVVLAYFALF